MSEGYIVEQLSNLFRNPRLAIPGVVDTFFGWLSTRRWGMIFGLAPFVLLMLSGIVFGLYVRTQHRTVLATPFIQKLEREMPIKELFGRVVDHRLFSRSDGSQAGESMLYPPLSSEASDRHELLIKHALTLDPTNQMLVFRRALLDDLSGDRDTAKKAFDDLSPAEKVMFVPGHAWQAVDLLSRAKGVPDLLILDHHLKAAGNWQSGDYRIYERASEIAEKESQVRMAFGLAKCAAELHPESNIRVADLASILGDRTDRKQALEKALSYFNERLTKDADQTAARLGLAACQQRLDRINDALATLRGSIGLANCDQTQIKGALVELLVQLHNKEVAKLSDYSMADLKKLNEAATHEGSNPKVAEAVAFLRWKKGKLDEGPATAALKRVMAEEKSTDLTHLYIGQVYLAKSEFANAVTHLKLALKKNDKLVEAMPLLAQASIQTSPPNVDLASQMIEKAILHLSPSAQIFELKGDIAHVSGDLKKATEAWERSIKLEDSNLAIRKKLYDTYRKMGLADEAEAHQQHLSDAKEKSSSATKKRK